MAESSGVALRYSVRAVWLVVLVAAIAACGGTDSTEVSGTSRPHGPGAAREPATGTSVPIGTIPTDAPATFVEAVQGFQQRPNERDCATIYRFREPAGTPAWVSTTVCHLQLGCRLGPRASDVVTAVGMPGEHGAAIGIDVQPGKITKLLRSRLLGCAGDHAQDVSVTEREARVVNPISVHRRTTGPG